MKHIIALTVISVFGMTNLANASPLSDCYDLVIDSCNQGNHPVPCAENGMDQCDEEYSAIIATTPKFQLKQTRQRAEMRIVNPNTMKAKKR